MNGSKYGQCLNGHVTYYMKYDRPECPAHSLSEKEYCGLNRTRLTIKEYNEWKKGENK